MVIASSLKPLTHDVLIVGGGPAGATLATLLARRGISALVLDKARFPRQKACAGLLSARSAALVRQIFGDQPLALASRGSSRGCRLYHRGTFVAETRDGELFTHADRKALDAALLAAAAHAGATVLEAERVVRVEPSRSAVVLASGRELRGAVIVGADGANSVVARSVNGARRPRPRGLAFGLVADVPTEALKVDPDGDGALERTQIHMGDVAWGYGWVVPKGEVASVGVAGLMAKNPDLRGRLKELVARVCVLGTYRRLAVRGHLLPFGNFRSRPGRRHVLLVGDAAGFVDPVTGEGVRLALVSASAAADAIERALAGGDPGGAGRLYQTAVRKRLLPALRQAAWGRWALFPRLCMSRATRSMGHHPELLSRYLELIGGRMTYVDFFGHVLKAKWLGHARSR